MRGGNFEIRRDGMYLCMYVYMYVCVYGCMSLKWNIENERNAIAFSKYHKFMRTCMEKFDYYKWGETIQLYVVEVGVRVRVRVRV